MRLTLRSIGRTAVSSVLVLLVTFALGQDALAQTGTVTGTVTDASNGETIPGANVQIVGTDIGAATDLDGEYTLEEVPVGRQTLRVTFVGFAPFEAQIRIRDGETVVQDAALDVGSLGLDEVVVTGYASQRRANITGSVASISTDEIEDIPVQNSTEILQGRAAGVTVATPSGNPGSGLEVRIRGQGSINADNEPLYVVDGVPMTTDNDANFSNRSPLNAINPADIQSIEVLKDASAAAIYGSQAANGVVLITTKTGRQGTTQVNLNFEGGVRFQSRRFDIMERDEWVEFQLDAFGEETFRSSILPGFGYDPNVELSELQDFDWQEWLFDSAPHRRVSFNVSGATESTNYYVSGGWTDTGGALRDKASEFRSYNFTSRLNRTFTERFRLDSKVTVSSEDSRGVTQDGFFIDGPFYQSIGEEPPISFPYLEDGDYNPNTEQSPSTNPAVLLNEQDRVVTTTQVLGFLQPTVDLLPWLSATGRASLDWQKQDESNYGTPTADPGPGGSLTRVFDTVTNLTLNTQVDAEKTFGDAHDVSGLALVEYRRVFVQDLNTQYEGFNNPLLRVPGAAGSTDFFGGDNTEYRTLSYVGRATYDYDDRYLLTLTGRYDGSSRFGSDVRWAFFPAASVAWRVSNEEFFNVGFVDDLKLRFGYGKTGNSGFLPTFDPLRNFRPLGLYETAGSYAGTVGFAPSQLENPTLTWEEKTEYNLAADWSTFNGRFTGSIDFYRSFNDQLLLARPLPSSSGFGGFTDNVGKVRNQGVEVQFETVNYTTESFEWSTRVNFGINENTVQELTEGAEALGPGGVLPVEVGRSLRGWSVPIWAGVNPADGRPMYYDADGNIIYEPTEADFQAFDGGEEDLVGGFGTTASYKGLSLDVFFDFQYGGTKLPNTQRSWTAPFGEGLLGELTERRWQDPGDIASWPRVTQFANFDDALNPGAISSLWLYRANFLRLKSVRLGYRLPQSVLNVVRLRNAQVYVTGLNLAYWTSYLGIDSEAPDAFEESSYPAEQQVNFGIQIGI